MIVRLWRTQVHPGREADYERFAQEHSLPMFHQQIGCLGVLFLQGPEDRAVLSLWTNEGAVAALSFSATYQQTTQRLEALGVLAGTPTVEVLQIHGGSLEGIDREDSGMRHSGDGSHS